MALQTKFMYNEFRSSRYMKKIFYSNPVVTRAAATTCHGGSSDRLGLILGVYTDNSTITPLPVFTPTGNKYNGSTNGNLYQLVEASGPPPKTGEVRVFYNLDAKFKCVALVGLGKECAGYDNIEERDEQKENVRIAAAVGAQRLQQHSLNKILTEGLGNTESAAEGAALGLWIYQDLRNKENQLSIPLLELYEDCDFTSWNIGIQKAAAQNLARQLMDTPANLMTPSAFAQTSVELLCKSGINVEVKVQGWVETQQMGGFLNVAKGSCEPPVFLEISYYGAPYEERPIVLIGSGLTFDSGGVCLKTIGEMLHTRGDMNGAACVVAATRAIAALKLPINIRGLIPLCENMPGCSAMKPGDIIKAMNGTNILVENTDCEGRLMLADTLFYSQHFWPKFIVDVGTLTKGIHGAMGVAATGVFTNSESLWKWMHFAGMHTGDRVWRFPLWDFFTQQVTSTKSADIKNVGSGVGGGACKAAAFLQQFVPCGEWLHLDTYNVMMANGIDHPYLRPGMSGRPTRTIVEFISQLSCIKCDK